MSPDPCFSDTCSVDLEFDGAGPGLTADVKIHDDEDRLVCTPDADPDVEGLMLIVGFEPFTINPAVFSVPDDSDTTFDLGTNFQNATGRDRLLISHTHYALNQSVTDSGGASGRFFKIDTVAQLLFNGADQWTNTNEVQGITPDGTTGERITSWDVTHHHIIPAGALINVEFRFKREDEAGTGYDGDIDTSGGDLGVNVRFDAVMLDLDSVTNLVSLI